MVFMHGICLFTFFLIKEFVFPKGFVFFAIGFGLFVFAIFSKGSVFAQTGLFVFCSFAFSLQGFLCLFFATLCISDRVPVWF